MAVSSRTASRVLLVAGILNAGAALVIATMAALVDGPRVPLLVLTLMALGLSGAAFALRVQLLRQYPPEPPASAQPEDSA